MYTISDFSGTSIYPRQFNDNNRGLLDALFAEPSPVENVELCSSHANFRTASFLSLTSSSFFWVTSTLSASSYCRNSITTSCASS